MLSQFATDYFARSPVLVFPVLALGLFFAAFVVVCVRALAGRRDEQARMAALPLSDSEVEHDG